MSNLWIVLRSQPLHKVFLHHCGGSYIITILCNEQILEQEFFNPVVHLPLEIKYTNFNSSEYNFYPPEKNSWHIWYLNET